jgi:hypothetical protein
MRTRNIKLVCLAMVSGMLVFLGCTKQPSTLLTTQEEFSNNSLVRVFVATANAAGNNIYLDTKLLNGATLASGGIFPASGLFASSVPAGLNAFLVTGSGTQVPLSFAENMELGRNYTIFLYDTITAPKQKTVETRFDIPTDSAAMLRFANFIYNPFAVPAIDVFSLARNTNIFTNVPVTGVTDFIRYPSRLGGDTLYIRETGSSVNILKVAIGSTTFQDKRFYTLVYRGSHRGTRVATLYTER